MTPDQWRRLEQIYHEAIELPTGERADFLARASAGDEPLRKKVEALLKSHDEGVGFLDKHALEIAARAAAQDAGLQGQHEISDVRIPGGAGVAQEPPGSLIGRSIGPYRVFGFCGAGGMGEVYLAEDTRLGRRLALKILPRDVRLDEDRTRRFMREAKAASALNHPNVATIYDIGETDGVHFIAMEYVEGQTIAQKIRSGPLDTAHLIEIGKQVADALDAAHTMGITHRDVKPANLMVTPRGQAKLLDFGLAKIRPHEQAAISPINHAAGTSPGIVMGTVAYMSPEQVLGKDVDHRTDIFSLGVVLYEMATAKSPFPGSSTVESMGRILHTPPEPMTALNGREHPELERIVRKCLEKEREDRYQSAQELLIDLRNLRPDSDSTRPVVNHGATHSGLKNQAASLQVTRRGVMALLGTSFLAGLGFWWQSHRGVPAAALKQTRISLFPGAHREASFSPDGSHIAFINDVDGVQQVWVKNLTGGEPRQITRIKEGVSRPRWSPKGNWILYTRVLPAEGLYPTGELWLVSPEGGEPRKLIGDARNGCWSGDGESLVFERGADLWMANADGSGPRRIENLPPLDLVGIDRRPALSPDGTLIAFFQHDEAGPWGDIWVIPSRRGVARRLTWDYSLGGGPAWTPDGRFVVFSSARRGSLTLWKVSVDRGTPEPLMGLSAGDDTDPEISPDGQKLIYTRSSTTHALVLTDSSGKDTNLFESGTLKGGGAISPRGDTIAFMDATESGIQLFTIGTDGKKLMQITRGADTQSLFPFWSADSSSLYYFQIPPNASFRKIPAQGGESVEIGPGWTWNTHNGAQVDPQGKRIIYSKLDRGRAVQTMIRDIQTGMEAPAPFTLALRHPRWSSDGKFVVGRDFDNITICPMDGGSCSPLTKGWTPNWSRGDSRIFFDREGPLGINEVRSITPDGRDEKKVADLENFSSGNFIDYSPAGQIVWVRSTTRSSELWLSSFPLR
jgi:serine/threonine protein kinase/Tol biopolymer transport system component